MSGAQYKKLHFDDELRELLRQASIDTRFRPPCRSYGNTSSSVRQPTPARAGTATPKRSSGRSATT